MFYLMSFSSCAIAFNQVKWGLMSYLFFLVLELCWLT
jgi:hypothetical protein